MSTIDINYEHIEEAAFLYGQRENIFFDPESDLGYQQEIEERLESHIDGLELDAKESKPVLMKYIGSEDEGEFFTALYSLLRIDHADPKEILDYLENNPILFQRAVVHVFRFLDSLQINERLGAWLSSDSTVLRLISSEVAGYKQKAGSIYSIEKLLGVTDSNIKATALKAINRIDPEKGKNIALSILLEGSDNEALLSACFENLFVQQEKLLPQIARKYCRGESSYHPDASVILALLTQEGDLEIISGLINSGFHHRSLTQAIGLSGRVGWLQLLIPLEQKKEFNLFIQESAHLVLGTPLPDFDDPDDSEEETKKERELFSLQKKLSSLNVPKSEWTKCFRLGKPYDSVNMAGVLENISPLYRKWLYLDYFAKKGNKIAMDHDSSASLQSVFIRNSLKKTD